MLRLAPKETVLFFWLQFALIVIGVTHYLTVWFFVAPAMLGCFIFFVFSFRFMVRKDTISFFFGLVLFGFFVRSGYNKLYFTLGFWQDLILILYNYGMVRVIVHLRLGKLSYLICVSILFLLAAYFLVGRLLGIDVLVLSKLLFSGSSYHVVAWLGLSLLAIVVISDVSKNDLLVVSFLYLVLCFAISGRSGIFISGVLFLSFLLLTGDGRVSFGGSLISAAVASLLILVVSFGGASIFKDVVERGATLGPREFIWLCYFDHLNIENMIWGFDKGELDQCITQYIPRVSVESSFFSLQVFVGVMFVPLMLSIFLRMYSWFKVDKRVFIVLVAFIFRMSTGEFVFFTVFDWLFLAILFHEKRGRFISRGNT